MLQKTLAGTWQKIENIKVQISYRSTCYLDYGWSIRKTIHEDSLLNYGSAYVHFVPYKMYMYVCCMTGFSAYSAKDSQKVDPLHDATTEKQSHAKRTVRNTFLKNRKNLIYFWQKK